MFSKINLRRYKTSIAVQNSFPNQAHTAENEFISRLKLCAERLAIDTHVVDCSDEVAATGANFLLSLHEVSPKLTPTLTIGAMWNPPSGIRHDPIRCEFVRSFDGYLSASSQVTRFIAEQIHGFNGLPKPVADFRFFPTSPRGVSQATSHDSLTYLGVHWDGARHGDFLSRLIRDGLLTVYGPQSAWRNAGSAYQGSIPFNGTSVIQRLAAHGIVLCLHREPHIADDTPSMRLFEAASAGCLILSDAIPFAVEAFGESIFVLPNGDGRAEFVREKVAWARSNPRRAQEMAKASQSIFERQYSLDVLLPKIVAFSRKTESTLRSKHFFRNRASHYGCIDLVCDLRSASTLTLDDVLAIANAQTYHSIRVLALCEEGQSAKVKNIIQSRRGVCLTELFLKSDQSPQTAIRLVHNISPYITFIHARTAWAPWHLSSLAKALKSCPDFAIAFSNTVISVTEDTLSKPPNFSGELEKNINENSTIISTDAQALPNSGHDLQIADLMSRSDWLARTPSFLAIDSSEKTRSQLDKLTVIKSGFTTCFVERKTAENLRPITFC